MAFVSISENLVSKIQKKIDLKAKTVKENIPDDIKSVRLLVIGGKATVLLVLKVARSLCFTQKYRAI